MLFCQFLPMNELTEVNLQKAPLIVKIPCLTVPKVVNRLSIK